jgi:hypothetical protein
VTRLAAFLLLSACATGPLPGTAPRLGVQFNPDSGGLAVAGTGQRVDFGRAPSGVIAVLDRELGPGRDLSLAGCPAGVVTQREWGGLVLSFTGERFVGWRDASGSAGRICAATS